MFFSLSIWSNKEDIEKFQRKLPIAFIRFVTFHYHGSFTKSNVREQRLFL